jgi:hypothetical protein
MRTRSWAIAAGLCAAAAIAVPTALADPPGQGLFATHTSRCAGTPLPGGVYDGYVTLVGGAGSTFWVNGLHLVIQQFDYTPDGGATQTFSIGHGNKTGHEGRPTVVCQGHFDGGYTIRSTSVVVP